MLTSYCIHVHVSLQFQFAYKTQRVRLHRKNVKRIKEYTSSGRHLCLTSSCSLSDRCSSNCLLANSVLSWKKNYSYYIVGDTKVSSRIVGFSARYITKQKSYSHTTLLIFHFFCLLALITCVFMN